MVDPIKLTEAADKDAAYVLRKIADADQHAKNALEHKEGAASELKLATEARIEAGKRLIEVHDRLAADKAASASSKNAPIPGWKAWLRDNGIDDRTARRHMEEATSTEEERTEKKQKDAKRKKEARAVQFSITRNVLLASRMGITERQASNLRDKNKEWFADKPTVFTDRAAAEAFALECIRVFPTTTAKTPELSETAQQKLERAIAIETAKLRDGYLKDLYAEVDRRMPEFVAEREKFMEENREETKRYRLLNMNTRKFITAAEYRKLIWALHPDRAPEARKEEFNTATIIVMKLKDYAEA